MNVHGFILPARIIGVLVLLGAIIPAAIGLVDCKRISGFVARATTTQGIVVAVQSSDFRDSTTYRSVFQYQDASGTTYRKVSSWSSNPPAHAVGQSVELLYDPNKPAEAELNSFASLWLVPIICGVATAVPLLIGIVFLWLIPFAIRRVWPEQPHQAMPANNRRD